MARGRHRGDGQQGRPSNESDRPKNTSDPKTCAHVGHAKTAAGGERGGFDRHCGSCDSEWWTPA